VVGLAEVDEFDHHLLAEHDVGGLEVEVGDVVLLEVPEALGEDVAEVDLGLVADAVDVLADVVREGGVVEEVGHQLVLVLAAPLNVDVVLGEEHGHAVLDLGQDHLLMRDPTPARTPLLPLHHDELAQDGHRAGIGPLHRTVAAVAAHVTVLYFSEGDAGEVAAVQLLEQRLLVETHVVQHIVVLVRSLGLLHAGRSSLLRDFIPFQNGEVEVGHLVSQLGEIAEGKQLQSVAVAQGDEGALEALH
jgi:hypothetical protein